MKISENQKNFLKIAASCGKEMEPVGKLAGKVDTISYELDDGPLTKEQIEAIRKASIVSDLPEERFTRSLFGEIGK